VLGDEAGIPGEDEGSGGGDEDAPRDAVPGRDDLLDIDGLGVAYGVSEGEGSEGPVPMPSS